MNKNRVSRARKLWVKLTHWEFWPFNVLYFPVYFYFTWLIIRCRSFFFFTASNPTIDFGGMLGESKSDIFKLIPDRYLPAYKKFPQNELQAALDFAQELGYPVVAKPDVGERGKLVEILQKDSDLEQYVKKCSVSFLIQEYIDYPVELGLFYTRHPDQPEGRITSIVQKDFLHVTGDGTHSVKDLLEKNPRAILQLDFAHPRFENLMGIVPAKGEKVIVEAVGNHCRGTTFLNKTDEVDDSLEKAFDTVSKEIDGFYFGRFDLRCKSLDDLRLLKNFKIMELNGAGAEPGHIYQPGFSLWQGYKSIFWHLKVLAQISRENNRRGHSYWSTKKGLKKIAMIRHHNRLINNSQ